VLAPVFMPVEKLIELLQPAYGTEHNSFQNIKMLFGIAIEEFHCNLYNVSNEKTGDSNNDKLGM